MSGTIKNIIILGVVGVGLVLVYIFFIKKGDDAPALSSMNNPALLGPGVNSMNPASGTSDEFLSVLLSVNSIKLDESVFSTPAFSNLEDGSIVLVPDGTEGRPNPFAPIGFDPSPTVEPSFTEEDMSQSQSDTSEFVPESSDFLAPMGIGQ